MNNEITPALVYWITRLESIAFFSALVLVIAFVVSIVSSIAYFVCLANIDRDDEDDLKILTAITKALKTFVPTAIVSCMICTFVPDTKEMAAIIVIPRIANSETVAELGDGVKTLAVEWLEELRPNKKEETK